jgi:hypothetical protein
MALIPYPSIGRVNAMAKKARPARLSGGNPQIAKADGEAPVQAYIAAMPGWKRDVGRRLDTPRLVPELPLLHALREGDLLPRRIAPSGSARQIKA